MACILLCNESVCADDSSHAETVSVTSNQPFSDSCPIVESAKAVIIDRVSFDLPVYTATIGCRNFISKPKTYPDKIIILRFKKVLFASPPLERLPVIRI